MAAVEAAGRSNFWRFVSWLGRPLWKRRRNQNKRELRPWPSERIFSLYKRFFTNFGLCRTEVGVFLLYKMDFKRKIHRSKYFFQVKLNGFVLQFKSLINWNNLSRKKLCITPFWKLQFFVYKSRNIYFRRATSSRNFSNSLWNVKSRFRKAL